MAGPCLHLFFAQDPQHGRVRLARPVVDLDGDPWGRLAPLRQDPVWRALIPEVPGEDLAHALHKYLGPLLRTAGVREPRLSLRVAQRELPRGGSCAESQRCAAHDPGICRPCQRVPACYAPPAAGDAAMPAREVVRAWADGYLVLVPMGDEFVLRGQRVGGA